MLQYDNTIVQEDIKELINRNIPFEKLKNKTIFVTGATGMLAKYMVYTLMHLNQECAYSTKVIALVRNEEKAKACFAPFMDNPDFQLLVQDICETIAIEDDVNYIVHAAGNASPKYILADPVGIIKANTLGTYQVLEFARRCSIENILYTSTREVYGKMDENVTIIRESDCGCMDSMDLRSCYPESKRLSETMLRSYQYQYNIPFTSARIAHAYGPGMEIHQDGRVMADFISDVVNKRNIILKSDGTALRSFCYITDAVAGLFYVLLLGENGQAYNVANEMEDIMIKDAAKMLVEIYPEKELEVVFDIPKEMSFAYSKMGRVKLDTNRLEQLGWRCNIHLRNGLRRTVDSFFQ